MGTSSSEPRYVAGQCNIGGAEVRQRRNAAILAAMSTGLLIALMFGTDVDRVFRIALFLPLVGTVATVEQARRRFCLAYGWRGVFSFERLGAVSRVDDELSRAADRSLVRSILLRSVLIASAGTVLLLLLP